MPRRRVIEEPDIPAQINIAPMIDVIFSILAFFIMSTLFLTRLEGLSVNLPKAQTSTSQKTSRATLTINQQGAISLNREPVAIPNLEAALRQQKQPGQELTVVLNADGAVKHEQVISVMDVIRKVPGTRLAIATRRP
ncbi:MAG TPA: biopolymer transporter ExbD [Leptolyngbyaceae cyanobacterium M33_DOE_097]|uniref:Biopolymer transporter ExbD n=1 Tax=Oscillatoriales cyanobacterium SpSt-418 TaxID=2282169 RepID=A0A7C3PBP5_9CYAN|nr:biopolymer transporter ExbD [Leptolyngbyaceae cyanobacterium M33_DOE_097]